MNQDAIKKTLQTLLDYAQTDNWDSVFTHYGKVQQALSSITKLPVTQENSKQVSDILVLSKQLQQLIQERHQTLQSQLKHVSSGRKAQKLYQVIE